MAIQDLSLERAIAETEAAIASAVENLEDEGDEAIYERRDHVEILCSVADRLAKAAKAYL